MAYMTGNVASGLTAQATGAQTLQLGYEGEALVREISGKWAKRALAKQIFIASTAIAGTIIPVNASNLVGTFVLHNPTGSGVNLELIKYRLGIAGTTTAVIGALSLAYQTSVPASLATTAVGTLVSSQIGSGQAAPTGVALYTSCTFVGTPTHLTNLGLSFGTTGATPGPVTAMVDFDGEIIVPPGNAITVVANAAQTQAMAQSISFAAVPTTIL